MRTGPRAFVLASCAALCVASAPTYAQGVLREAIPVTLGPADAERLFGEAVSTICVAAISQGIRVAQLPMDVRSEFAVTRDPQTRAEVGATPEETVWEAVDASRVVTIRETSGRCIVMAYGPPAAMALSRLAGRLSGDAAPFERLMPSPGRTGLAQSLMRRAEGRRVQVLFDGSEPDMPGHRSRFSVISATVFSLPG